MAAVSKEINIIVARVRRVWGDKAIERSDGGNDWLYRITAPDGHRVQLHSSPSDSNWERVVMRQLNQHGFSKDEVEYLKREEKERQDKLEAARQKAADDLEKAQKRALTVAKAAGPYGPQVASVPWIFTAHDLPETRHCLITPELARKIVDELNTRNRPLRDGKVEFWRLLMRNGHWRYTHQGVAFDLTGALQDGQHRLEAAAREGFTLDINVSVGMPVENFTAVDTGAPRSGSDTLAVEGRSNASILAAATKLIFVYDRYGVEMRTGIRARMPNDSLAEAASKYGKRLDDAVAWAKTIRSKKGAPKMSSNALAAGIFLISRRLNKTDPRVEEFLRGFRDGSELASGDARNALRTFMFNMTNTRTRRVSVEDQLGIFIKAWNLWVNGRGTNNLAFRRDEIMPRVFLPPKDE
jgi:hypothetical protein